MHNRHIAVVLKDPMQPVGEGAGLLVGAEEGAGQADASCGRARGDRHLGVGVGGKVRAAQPVGASIAPSAHGSLGPVDQGGQKRHLG